MLTRLRRREATASTCNGKVAKTLSAGPKKKVFPVVFRPHMEHHWMVIVVAVLSAASQPNIKHLHKALPWVEKNIN